MVKISFDLLCQMYKMKGEMNSKAILKGTTTPAGPWTIDFEAACGFYFKNVMIVKEPLSQNPGIEVPRAFGLRGMKQAIALIEAERTKHGVTTLV